MTRPKIMIFPVFLLLLGYVAANAGGEESLEAQLSAGGHVLMIRHAYAPGTGDPDNFQIGDCATQRNLNDQGRAQASQIGQWLRARGIDTARVYSSQWCRCLETAEGIGLGPVAPLPALNSFFEHPRQGKTRLAAVRHFLSKQPANGKLIILVTHHVTIAGITGESVSSGEAVLMRLTGSGDFKVLGRLNFNT